MKINEKRNHKVEQNFVKRMKKNEVGILFHKSFFFSRGRELPFPYYQHGLADHCQL